MHGRHYGIPAAKGVHIMINMLQPILELCVVIPGVILAYFPVKSGLKHPIRQIMIWLLPLLLLLCITGGSVCYIKRISTIPALALILSVTTFLYIKTLRISLWKSGTVALSICAVFACINSLSRAVNAVLLMDLQPIQADPWLCLQASIFYNAICWLLTAVFYYPAVHAVKEMVDDENFAPTWYVFWVLPLIFIALNLFMIPRYSGTLYVGRILKGYFVLSLTLLILLLWFSAAFLIMATILNRNARLRQENQLLSMQQQRYENLKASIEEMRQARHDMRHHLNQISRLAEEENLPKLKEYLTSTICKIPDFDMHLCENQAADSVAGYYYALARRENIPFSLRLDLPARLPVDEVDLCLVLSNLLENALEASLRIVDSPRHIRITSYLHAGNLLLIQVENTYVGEILEKNGVFQSSKRKGEGIGLQSVRHIAEKSGGASTFSHQNGIFCAKVMLCGKSSA